MEKDWIGIEPVMDGRDIWDKVKEVYGDTPIRILEIGVYRAGQIRRAHGKGLQIKEYIGVDPYYGNSTDSYTKLYWQNEIDSFKIYQKSKKVFEEIGGCLYRTTSQIYYGSLEADELFDVIYVDGCHLFEDALWDLSRWYTRLRPGGMLIVDDYGNVDTPDVTRAVTEFIKAFKPSIEEISFERVEFKNAGKYIPISLEKVFILKGKGGIWHPKRVALWGTAAAAREFLQTYGNSEIDCIINNDHRDKELEICGIKTKSIQDIDCSGEYLFILARGSYIAMKEQLTAMGMEEKNYISMRAFPILRELLLSSRES